MMDTGIDRPVSPRRHRRYLVLAAVVVLLAGGWAVLWKYAASATEGEVARWREREAKSGRVYDCARQTVAGFPFRIEVICDGVSAALRNAQPPLELKAKTIHVASQLYQPDLLIAEYEGPLTVAETGKPPSLTANWSLAQSSVRGTPDAPERASLVVDDPVVDGAVAGETVLRAKKIEVHGRLSAGSAADRPVIDVVVRSEQLVSPAAGPLGATPIDIEMLGTLSGLKDFAPKPWAERFREIQASGGRLDLTQVRFHQGETIAIGSGALTVNAAGRLEGELKMAVAGAEALINAAAQQRTGLGITLGLGMLGGNIKVDGRPAIALPARISNGVVSVGPLRLGEIPALF